MSGTSKGTDRLALCLTGRLIKDSPPDGHRDLSTGMRGLDGASCCRSQCAVRVYLVVVDWPCQVTELTRDRLIDSARALHMSFGDHAHEFGSA